MRRLILATLAAASIGGGALAAAVPASASTGRPSAVTSLCPPGGGFNGTQQDAGGLYLTASGGVVIASRTPTITGSCFRWAPPTANARGSNPKVAQEAPLGTANGQAITVTPTGQLVLNRDANAADQQFIYNGDGTFSPASNPGVVITTNGNGGQVTVTRYNPADVTPAEDLTFIPGA